MPNAAEMRGVVAKHERIRDHDYSDSCHLCTLKNLVPEMCERCGDLRWQHEPDRCVVTDCECKGFVAASGE